MQRTICYVFIAFVFCIFNACDKLERVPAVATPDARHSGNAVIANGLLIDAGENLQDYGYCWSVNELPDISHQRTTPQTEGRVGDFSLKLSELLPNTSYRLRAFVKDANTTVYSEEVQFQTYSLSGLYFETDTIIFGGGNAVTVQSQVNAGSFGFEQHGHCWSENTNEPSISTDETTFLGTLSDTAFNSVITLEPSVTYYVRPYVQNSKGDIRYGQAEVVNTAIGHSKIEIYAPENGSNWRIDSTYTISWYDNVAGTLRLELLQNGTSLLTIAENAQSDGSYAWHIPENTMPGTGYQIKISETGNNYVFDVSAEFAIVEKKVIQMTAPQGGETLQAGSSFTIEWTDNISENVIIELYKRGNYTYTIAESTPSDGEFFWQIPTNLPSGNDYRIKIRSSETAILFDFSENFTILQ